MNFFNKLSAGLTVLLACTCLNAGSVETRAGIAPFTLFTEGGVRYYYDDYSRLAQISYINSAGQQYATQEWSYDSYGTVAKKRLTESRGFWFARISSFAYTYSQTNRILQETQDYGFSAHRLSYHYNVFGNLDSVQAFDLGFFSNTAREKVANRYNPEGRLEARTFYDAIGQIALHHEWDYDFQGRLAYKRVYDQNMNLTARVLYEYDASSGVDIETNVDAYNTILSQAFTYRDAQGYIQERDLRDSAGNLVAVTTYEYDFQGLLVRIKDCDANARVLGCITTYYDQFNRPYLYDFSYRDGDLLIERTKECLMLPGNDL